MPVLYNLRGRQANKYYLIQTLLLFRGMGVHPGFYLITRNSYQQDMFKTIKLNNNINEGACVTFLISQF